MRVAGLKIEVVGTQDKVIQLFIAALTIGLFLAIPVIMIAGWVQWIRIKQPATISGILSTIAFSLASASVVLAIFTFIYARAILGFPFYDPLLMRIYDQAWYWHFLAFLAPSGDFGIRAPSGGRLLLFQSGCSCFGQSQCSMNNYATGTCEMF